MSGIGLRCQLGSAKVLVLPWSGPGIRPQTSLPHPNESFESGVAMRAKTAPEATYLRPDRYTSEAWSLPIYEDPAEAKLL